MSVARVTSRRFRAPSAGELTSRVVLTLPGAAKNDLGEPIEGASAPVRSGRSLRARVSVIGAEEQRLAGQLAPERLYEVALRYAPDLAALPLERYRVDASTPGGRDLRLSVTGAEVIDGRPGYIRLFCKGGTPGGAP